eukprot:5343230-Amphidinium_carterae.1
MSLSCPRVQSCKQYGQRNGVEGLLEFELGDHTRQVPFRASVNKKPHRGNQFRCLPFRPETVTPQRALHHVGSDGSSEVLDVELLSGREHRQRAEVVDQRGLGNFGNLVIRLVPGKILQCMRVKADIPVPMAKS